MRQRSILVRPGAIGISGLLLPFLLTACSASGAGSADRLGTPSANLPRPTATTTAAPAPTGSPVPKEGAQGLEGNGAVTAYQDWWDVQVEVLGRSDSDGVELRQYATGTAFTDTAISLTQLHDARLVMVGRPRTSPVLKSLDLQANPPTATIDDCLDVSDWHQADAATKEIKDPQQRLSRFPATAVLKKYGNRWLIADFTREVTKTC
ncbi:hypothetical protein Kpho02_04350 [Kitasatospora phosalacinea]|uniref:Secreted protein n=1 Tax=Kitasatospora phosalacinea TaxID=2065 RepID=A0A9W6Q431_9ACTN|nr:hypothetical protein [Kitasatospora phosalacinea]GLW68136.1 hypothetical protein Kpho02_04350 [Kitasatospora phosalacinea]